MINISRKLIKTEQEFNKMLIEIHPYKIISFDTENNGLNPKFAIAAGYSICIYDYDNNEFKSYYLPINHTDIKTNFQVRLKEITFLKNLIIMQNSVYDAGIVKHQYNSSLEPFRWFDTMIGEHLLNEEARVGLKYMTEKYFKEKQTSFREMMGSKEIIDPTKVTSESIYKYACDDAIYTYRHYLRQKPLLEKEGLMQLMEKVEMPFQKTLSHIKSNGIVFDSKLNQKIENKLIVNKEICINNMIKVTPKIRIQINLIGERIIKFNFKSSKELQKLLYINLKLPIKGYTKAGSPSVESKILKLLKINNKWLHPIIPYLIEYKGIEKLLSSYTSSLRKTVMENGKLYADLLDHGTVTGRLSMQNPSLHQLPKNDKFKIRDCFLASKGYKMLSVDFSQEEVRICGIISQSKTLKQACNEEQDIHLSIANIVWNLGIPEEYLKKTNTNYETYLAIFKKERTASKCVVFGLMYGKTFYGLANQLNISKPEAQKIFNDFFNTFPEIRNAINNSETKVKLQGFVKNLYNRKRRFKKVIKDGKSYYNKRSLRQAFNFIIQSSASDILRVVMNQLYKYIKKVGNEEIRILMTIHDEVVFEIIDNEKFNKHKRIIKYIMENSVQTSIPLTVDCGEGYNYGDAK